MPVTEAELKSFTEFVSQRMAEDSSLSLRDCLDRWQEEREREETIADMRQSLADIEAGRVRSLEEADVEIRRRLGWPARTS